MMTVKINRVGITVFSALAVLFSACSHKSVPDKIDGWKNYTDDSKGFGMKIPANWIMQKSFGTNLICYSNDGVKDRIQKQWQPDGIAGARISIEVIVPEEGDSFEQTVTNNQEFTGVFTNLQDATLAGKPAKKCVAKFELEDGEVQSEMYAAQTDSAMITVVTLTALGGTFNGYRKEFDEMLKSVTLAYPMIAKSKTDTLKGEEEKPSETFRPVAGQGFSIQVPDNFSSQRAAAKGAIFSQNFMSPARAECSIQIDVLDASKQKNLEKIVTDSKAAYSGAGATQSGSISGQASKYFSYSIRAGISSRVYFAVKGDKLFRVTLNWLKTQESDYLPKYEKAISTLQLQ